MAKKTSSSLPTFAVVNRRSVEFPTVPIADAAIPKRRRASHADAARNASRTVARGVLSADKTYLALRENTQSAANAIAKSLSYRLISEPASSIRNFTKSYRYAPAKVLPTYSWVVSTPCARKIAREGTWSRCALPFVDVRT